MVFMERMLKECATREGLTAPKWCGIFLARTGEVALAGEANYYSHQVSAQVSAHRHPKTPTARFVAQLDGCTVRLCGRAPLDSSHTSW